MMGRLERGQDQLFYNVCLETLVPRDHLARKLDAVLDLSCQIEFLRDRKNL